MFMVLPNGLVYESAFVPYIIKDGDIGVIQSECKALLCHFSLLAFFSKFIVLHFERLHRDVEGLMVYF